MKLNSLKRKFIIFAIVIIMPITTSNIISLIINNQINENYNMILNKMSMTSEIKNYLNDSFNNFNKYVLTNVSECKGKYEDSYNKSIEDVELLQKNSDLESQYILRDLINSLKSYKVSGDATIKLYDNQAGVDIYYENYVSTKDISNYCYTFLSKLIDSYTNYNNNIYNKLEQKEKFINKILITYIITALLISFLYTVFFLKDILEKLNELVEVSKRVSSGNFTYYEGKKTFIYELDILSAAFSSMINDIRKYVNSLKENAELEKRIKDDEMKVLKYQNAIKLSQLKILQSQINPHFLFNTLNCISQTAIKENAETTETLIRSVSGILRYSLSMIDRNATLEEEVNVVKQYIYIQKLRFQERIEFNININTDLNKVKVPGMTLQPFVENAFIHGIEPKEEGGAINIEIYEKENFCMIMIEDNGCGMDEEILNKIVSEDQKKQHKGHTTGMGIRSVVERLKLMYTEDEIFKIESKKELGTRIYLKIPIMGGENMLKLLVADDENYDRDGIITIVNKEFKEAIEIREAKNGREAIEISEQIRPDIIIMDIKMPGINGLKAIQEIRTFLPSAYFIILTAYDYFDFAVEAVKNNVKAYILKPFSREELIEKIKEAIEIINKEKEKRKSEIENQEKIYNLIPALENELCFSIINNTVESIDGETYMKYLDVNFKNTCAMVINIGEKVKEEFNKERLQDYTKMQVGEYIKKQINRRYRTIGSYHFTDELIYFIRMKEYEDEEDTKENTTNLAIEIKKNVKKLFDISLHIGIGKCYDGLTFMYKSYKEAIQALKYSLENGGANHFTDIKIQYSDEEILDKGFIGNDNSKIKLFKIVGKFIEDNMKDELDLEKIAAKFNLSPYYFSRTFKEVLGCNFSDYINIIRINKAKEFLKSDSMSIKEICFSVGYSDPNYFSKVFKKHVGMSPSEFKMK